MDGDGYAMTLEGLLKDVSYEILQEGNGLFQEISSVTHDSRKVAAGGLFICLLGLNIDGHEYIDEAARAGVGAVLVERFNNQNSRPDDITDSQIDNVPNRRSGRMPPLRCVTFSTWESVISLRREL